MPKPKGRTGERLAVHGVQLDIAPSGVVSRISNLCDEDLRPPARPVRYSQQTASCAANYLFGCQPLYIRP